MTVFSLLKGQRFTPEVNRAGICGQGQLPRRSGTLRQFSLLIKGSTKRSCNNTSQLDLRPAYPSVAALPLLFLQVFSLVVVVVFVCGYSSYLHVSVYTSWFQWILQHLNVSVMFKVWHKGIPQHYVYSSMVETLNTVLDWLPYCFCSTTVVSMLGCWASWCYDQCSHKAFFFYSFPGNVNTASAIFPRG